MRLHELNRGQSFKIDQSQVKEEGMAVHLPPCGLDKDQYHLFFKHPFTFIKRDGCYGLVQCQDAKTNRILSSAYGAGCSFFAISLTIAVVPVENEA